MRECPACGTDVSSKPKQVRYCSVSCASRGPRAQRGPLKKERGPQECPACKSMFTSRWGRQVCCSRSCARVRDAAVNGPSNWKGGVNRHASGYLKEQRKGHPYADKAGYVMQHRLVMEGALGRTLERHERVHHRNGIRDDNRIENLELWTTQLKDPSGVRLIDHVRHLITRLTAEDRRALQEHLV